MKTCVVCGQAMKTKNVPNYGGGFRHVDFCEVCERERAWRVPLWTWTDNYVNRLDDIQEQLTVAAVREMRDHLDRQILRNITNRLLVV